MGSATVTIEELDNPTALRTLKMGVRGTGSTPSVATDWPGDAFPVFDITFQVNETSKQVTLTNKPNTIVDGNRQFELYKMSSTPTDATFAAKSGSTLIGTITDDDQSSGGGGTTPATMTLVYGPVDGGADSGTVNLQSKVQQCGRTWRSGAPTWKVILGQNADGNTRTGLFIIFKDSTNGLTYVPHINTQLIHERSVDVAYTGAAPSASEPFTYVRLNEDMSVQYCCAATAPTTAKPKPADERVLATISKTIWDDIVFWGSQAAADRVPDKYAQSNADQVVANGIYAARLGAVQ